MIELHLELEFAQPYPLGNDRVDIKCIKYNQYDDEDWEYYLKSLA